MFSQRSNSFFAKQRKNGEQPTQSKQRTPSEVFSKKRPLAQIQFENIGIDFPNGPTPQRVFKNGQPIFQSQFQKEINLDTSKSAIQTQRPPEADTTISAVLQKPQPQTTETQDFRQLVTLDANSQGFQGPSLEEYSRYKNLELAKKEQADSANEILNSLTQPNFDELEAEIQHQFHPNMIQAMSKQLGVGFTQGCSMATFLQPNLFCCVKNYDVFIYNQQKLLHQMSTKWPVKHVFFNQDILYVSTTEELLYVKLSESAQMGLQIDQTQEIGVSAEKVINTSAIVNGKIFVGMSKASELQVNTERKSFLSCKTGQNMSVQLPKKSFLSSMTSFFMSKDKVTQIYDIPSIDLAVAFLEHNSKYHLSEVQLFDRNSLEMCGKFTVQWLTKQLENFLTDNGMQQTNDPLVSQTEVLNISGKFYDLYQERHLVITFKNGVQSHLYLAPDRNQNGSNQISEDDISVFSIQSSPVEGCLEQLKLQQGQVAQKYRPPLLSMRQELLLQPPFQNDFCLATYTIISFKCSKLLSVYVVEQDNRLYLITQVQQKSQAISSIHPLKGSVFFDMLIDDQRHHQIVKILTNHGLEQYQQKTLRDHIGSYLYLSQQVKGGLEKAQQLKLDFEQLLNWYPLNDIFAVLVDFMISDQMMGQPIYHDVNVQNFYFNQTQPPNLEIIKLSNDLSQESLNLFESLLRRMREQFDKSRWEICGDVVHEVLQTKSKNLLQQYPFKLNRDGVSPELLKESLVNIDKIIEFLKHLKCQESKNCIIFCNRLREVCKFVLIILRGTNWDVSAVINQVFDEDKQLIQDVNIYELMNNGLESVGLQIFLENYLSFHKHDQRVCQELIGQCCSQFLNPDFFILSQVRQIFIRTDSKRQEVTKAVKDLCTHINKSLMFATFNLLLENFEIYGIDPLLSYLKCYIDTKFVHIQWCDANQRELLSIASVQESRLQAMYILLELVEELGWRIQGKSKEMPQPENQSIKKFREKLLKNSNQEQLQQCLTYIVLRIEKIEEQWLHNNLFALLIDLGLSQFIRQCSSKYLVQFFKDKIGQQEETGDGIQITADNLILLKRFEECFLFITDQISSSRHLTCVQRATFFDMPIKQRIDFLQKAQLCLDNIASSTQKQKWVVEIGQFRKLITLQAEVYDQLQKTQRKPTEEQQFKQKELHDSLFSVDQLVQTCFDNSLFVQMLQAIMIKVDPIGIPFEGFTAQEIDNQVLQCYSGLVKQSQADEFPDVLETLYQIQLAVFNRQKQENLLRNFVRNRPIKFFPLDQILALVVSQNKVTERLMSVLLVHLKMAPTDIIDVLIRISTPDNKALIATQPVISLLLRDEVLFKSIEQVQLKQLRQRLVEGFIEDELRHSMQTVNQAEQAVADIDKLISL